MAGTRFEGGDRRIGHQLDVRPVDLGGVLGEDDRAVHLRQLVEERGRVVDIELDSARIQERQLVAVAYADESACMRVQDVLDHAVQVRPRELRVRQEQRRDPVD